MANLIYKHIIGFFAFDEQGKVLEQGEEQALRKKYTLLAEPSPQQQNIILGFYKNPKFFDELHSANIALTKKDVKAAVKTDNLIQQALLSLEEIDHVANMMSKRLREWYELYNPEFSKSIESHEKFSELIMKKDKKTLLKEIGVAEEQSMGAELDKDDVNQILSLAWAANALYKTRKSHEDYLTKNMEKLFANLTAITGHLLGAKLIAHAGSAERLVKMPASTIQMLGAEKALFRHMKNKKRFLPPKYGLLFAHPMIQKTPRQTHGKVARALADKISIAIKVDYFKGKFIGDELMKALEERFR